ncbi:MAG: Jag N-terminal domain-containing protein [Lachnospiraceae bacterium]|nr:Jag N-terminal domain-containing protein [Lachnospiraceae bacterium]
MEYREYTGKTLEDAKAAAAAELGCAVEDLRVEVLEEEKGGFFGLFKSVKIRVECDESMIAPANVTEAVAAVAAEIKAGDATGAVPSEVAVDFICKILKVMDLTAEVTARSTRRRATSISTSKAPTWAL